MSERWSAEFPAYTPGIGPRAHPRLDHLHKRKIILKIKPILVAALLMVVAASSTAFAKSNDEMVAMLKDLDSRQQALGDFKAHAFIQRKEKGKEDVLYESLFYRRGADNKFMFLVLAPKTEAGQGYLRIDDNLWLYSPRTGKWERLTERDRILGTDGRRQDFDESRLAEEYDPSYLGEGKLGKYKTHRLKLNSKSGKDVAWSIVELDVDQESGNVLRRLDFAGTDKLMRRTLYPKWLKITDPKGKEVWYAEQSFFYDEVEKGNESLVRIKAVDLTTLPANMFTKAWLESKSR